MWETFVAPQVRSLTDTVRVWVDLLDSDTYHWNVEEDGWDVVRERVPLEARMSWII
jgi:hypothetical protein